jgi:uncharacterized protein (DUF1499 family)
MQRSVWIGRLGRLAMWASLLGVAMAVVGATLARYDFVAKITGFMGLFFGLPLVFVAGVVGLLVLLVALVRKLGPKRPAFVGFIVAALFVGPVLSIAGPGLSAPPIHDITTDLANPPAFTKLTLRKDNLVGVESEDNWRAVHAGGYPDIRPVTIAKPVVQVIADAERLARARGWTIAVADPAAGRLEATAEESYFRFHDDVVLRVRPNGAGGSVVDMRSVSRVGVSDLGVNARRVRNFLADLQKA